MEIGGGGVRGMLPRDKLDFPDLHVCILRCFEAHKWDNNNIKNAL